MKTAIKYLIIVAIIIAGLPGSSLAQRINATAKLDSAVILVGDQVNLKLRINKPEEVKAWFPAIADSIAEKIEVLKRSAIDTFRTEGSKIQSLEQTLTITCFDTGRYYIPNYWFAFESNGIKDSTPTNSLLLDVIWTMPIDTTKGPTDIKMPYDAPVTLKEVMPYILGVILLGAILFFILYSIKRKKQNKPLFSLPEKPKEPAHIVALRELDRIKDEKIWQKEKIKQYYSEVTETIRVYIENRFEIPAMEQTSEETIASLKIRKGLMSEKNLSNLSQMLYLADMVKFAKYTPLPDDHNLTLVNAYFFVNDTKPETAQPESKPAQAEDNGVVEEVDLN
jgi:hypothetical protein